MEEARLVREYLGTLAWPAVVLVLMALFVKWFRPEIADLIRRTTGVRGPMGTGLEAAPNQQPGTSEAPPPSPELSATIEEAARERQQLEQSAQTYYLYWLYEKAFRLIFGTQIALLKALSMSANGGGEFQAVQSLHSRHLQLVQTTIQTTLTHSPLSSAF